MLLLEDDEPLPSTGIPVPQEELPADWRAFPSPRTLAAPKAANRPPFFYDPSAPERGLNALRLFELRDYSWQIKMHDRVSPPHIILNSSLKQSADRDLWKQKQGHGRFQFVNYLGSAWIEATVSGQSPVRIAFDVASPKLDYEQEYRSMVLSIGEECQQLLLEWGTPTTLHLTANPEQQMHTLLEQFLFLRHVLGTNKLELYLEVLQRRPHSRLESERNWKPAGATEPSSFVSDPIRHGRDWHRGSALLMPEEILEERKFDSLDTPPNRFVKFALQSFLAVCDAVLGAQKNSRPVWNAEDTVYLEAISLQHSLNSFLALPLFNEVGEMRRVPFESTTLQRREGYREILIAWLMLDAAAQIEWPGRGDCYDGTSRDVATLYEYWLYFLIVRALQRDLGMVAEQDPLAPREGSLPFCCRQDDGRLRINLEKGKNSVCRLRWEKHGRQLRVHLFYNRSFSPAAIGESGSYSKTFRPDYSLVIIPEEFDNQNWRDAEQAAEKAGRIAYLHFDAKYRGDNLPGLFGTADLEEDYPEDNRSRASGKVKNIDLYKMHSYNEAIRRTIGSYVLYPGIAPDPKEGNARFERYHELIPGIGAFAIRPSGLNGLPLGLPLLIDFIRDLLTHQLNRFTQSFRISFTTEETIREKPIVLVRQDSVIEKVFLPSATVILGFMKKADVPRFRASKYFYCPAITQDNQPVHLDISAAQSALFLGWSGQLIGPFHTSDWIARIASCRLVGKETIQAQTGIEPSSGSVPYLFFSLTDFSCFDSREVTALVAANNNGGQGSRFHTFQMQLIDVMEQKLGT